MFMREQGWKRQKASQYYENGFDLADPPEGASGDPEDPWTTLGGSR